MVFICAVAKDLSIHEDLVGLIPFHDTAHGVDTGLKETVLNVLLSKMPNLLLSKLEGLTTDTSFSGLLVKHRKDFRAFF